MLNRTVAVSASTARRRNAPGVLPLHQPYRRGSKWPQSPVPNHIFVDKSLVTPPSPSVFFVPITPQPVTPGRTRKRIENLTYCLRSGMPAEVLYPSIGQVCAEAENVTSFLDLYRKGVEDEEALTTVKSPTSKAGSGPWRTFAAGDEEVQRTVRRRPAVRRSRSLSDLRSQDSETKGKSGTETGGHTYVMAGKTDTTTPTIEVIMSSPKTSKPSRATQDHTASQSLRVATKGARSSIINTDAKRMADFRRALRPRDLALPIPPPDAPLPSPPAPSPRPVQSPLPITVLTVSVPPPLLSAQDKTQTQALPQPRAYMRLRSPAPSTLRSPQAPYWVKARSPKTPRTVRSERRQGWGGQWTMGSMGQVVGQLKEM